MFIIMIIWICMNDGQFNKIDEKKKMKKSSFIIFLN